jgi:toxin ParE1/3/4
MKYKVVVLPEAKEDVLDIYFYIAKHDSILRAETLVSNLEEKFLSLIENPERGHAVPESKCVHVEGFREIHYKPYRIIFQIIAEIVFVHAVLDGRRELQEIIERRILQ